MASASLPRLSLAATRHQPVIRAALGRRLHLKASNRPKQRAVAAWASDPRRRQPPRTTPPQEQRHTHSSASNAVLSNTTSFLRNLHNGAEIFLVGTAHVSKQSAVEVREMIRLVKPDTVMVELCPERAARLRAGGSSDQDFLKQMLGSMLAPGSSLSQKLVQASLPMMYRGMKMLGMDPGAEFKVALEEAERLGARVVYGDRDGSRTLKRLSEAVDLGDVLRMMSGAGMPAPPDSLTELFTGSGGNLESQVESMKTRKAVRDMGRYMRQVNPAMATALIDERDAHMVRELSRLEGRVVGVVGLAHLDGMERRWEELMYSGKALAPAAVRR
ncbi:hypothetical protein D9Q98_010116 [Chlorella vulgaris]|uniref:TraB family protein n=1 Tax=Chlorella vulgaris TaxID=3077 RepID=A0A9D4YWE1_CHLVU|nr:hypothetical protein D9Q98_010116 [Chlorella vulgaris]